MKPAVRNPSKTTSNSEPSAVERVVGRLMELILGELAPGTRLPSEAELARQYEVSRLTVREAVKVLAGRGLLEVSRGRRAVVREPDGSAFGDFLMGSLPANTGRKMHFTGTTVLKVINGKIVSEIGLDDGVTALTQLGLIRKA